MKTHSLDVQAISFVQWGQEHKWGEWEVVLMCVCVCVHAGGDMKPCEIEDRGAERR